MRKLSSLLAVLFFLAIPGTSRAEEHGSPAGVAPIIPGMSQDAVAPVSSPIPQSRPATIDGSADAVSRSGPAPDSATPPNLDAVGPDGNEDGLAACLSDLARVGTAFERLGPISGEGACGAPYPLRVSAVAGVEIRPPSDMRCPVARSLAFWIDRVAAPLSVLYLDRTLAAVTIGTDYQCRQVRGSSSRRLSEHAFANALDVTGLIFESGEAMPIKVRAGSAEPERGLQAGIRGGACAFFTTVLGPQTNPAHRDHLHLDMAERRGGYRICE